MSGRLPLATLALLVVALHLAPVTPVSAAPPADSPQITVEVEPRPAEVGLIMNVAVTVSGEEGADCSLVGVPRIDGARLTLTNGPVTHNMSMNINGRRSVSMTTRWDFELVPQRPGLMDIPPFRFNCRGREVSSDPVPLTVQDAVVEQDVVRLEIEPSTTTLWVGQIVELNVNARIREDKIDQVPRNGIEFVLPWLDGLPELSKRDAPSPGGNVIMLAYNQGRHQLPTRQSRVRVDGAYWIDFAVTVPMVATEPGTVVLPQSRFGARIVTEVRATRQPQGIFQFFNSQRGVPTRVVMADAVLAGPVLTIRPTPTEGRPADYTNAVGSFRFEIDASPRNLKVGESCMLWLTLSLDSSRPSAGGNLDLVEWPDYGALLSDFRMFGKEESDNPRVRVMELEMSPRNDRVTQIPALPFSYFDPVSERYETIMAGPLEVEVASGGDDGLTTALELPEEMLNDLETIRETLPAPRQSSFPAWALWALGGVVLAGVELIRLRRRLKGGDAERIARRGAARQLQQDLTDVVDARMLSAAFARYLSARFGGPAGGMTAEEAAPRITDTELAGRVVAAVSSWEAAYLGGASLDLSAACAEARDLAQRLEQLT